MNEKLLSKIAFYGYTKGITPLTIDTALWNVLISLRNWDLNVNMPACPLDIETIKKDTKAIFGTFFSLHDVHMLSPEDIQDFNEKTKQNQVTKEDINKIITDPANIISPFDLPVSLTSDNSLAGNAYEFFIFCNKLPDIPPIFSGVNIQAPNNEVASSAYCHELTHTQIPKEAIKNYRYDEVLPIFAEKLQAYHLSPSCIRFFERMRLQTLANKAQHLLSDPTNLEDACYITSTLITENIFDHYVRGTEEEKEQIINGIQDVFLGKCSLEELLSFLGITEENSKSVSMLRRNLIL